MFSFSASYLAYSGFFLYEALDAQDCPFYWECVRFWDMIVLTAITFFFDCCPTAILYY